jgi:hypothetical protein
MGSPIPPNGRSFGWRPGIDGPVKRRVARILARIRSTSTTLLNVFHRQGQTIRHFRDSEMPYAPTEPDRTPGMSPPWSRCGISRFHAGMLEQRLAGVARVVMDHIDDSRLDHLYRIGVDEISYKRGHKFADRVERVDILGGLIHEHRRAA